MKAVLQVPAEICDDTLADYSDFERLQKVHFIMQRKPLALALLLWMGPGFSPLFEGGRVEAKTQILAKPFLQSEPATQDAEQWAKWLIEAYLWSKDNFEVRTDPELTRRSASWTQRWQRLPQHQKQTLEALQDLFEHDYPQVQTQVKQLQATRNWPYPALVKALLGEQDPESPGLWRISLKTAREIRRRYPQLKLGRVMLAEAILERQQPESKDPILLAEARDALKPLLQDDSLGYSHYQMGQILFLEEKPEAAEQYFIRYFEQDPLALEAVGNFYLWMGEHEEALDFYERSLTKQQYQPRVYQKMELLYGESQPEQIVRLYLQALKAGQEQIYPQLQQAYGYATPEQIQSWVDSLFEPQHYYRLMILGDQALRKQQPKQARNFYQQALQQAPEKLLAYQHLLTMAWETRELEQMEQLLAKAQEHQLQAPELNYWRGVLALARQQPAEAIQLLKPLAEKYVPARYSLAMAYRQQKDFVQARQLMASLIKFDPQNLNYLLTLGDFFMEEGKPAEAKKIYDLAAQLEPEHPQVNFSLGNYYTARQDYAKAAEALERAVLAAPDAINIRNNLGNVYLRMQKLELAREVFGTLVQKAPDYAPAYYNLACAEALSQQTQSALLALEKAIQLDPELKKTAREDADLTSLRPHPRFQELLQP